MCRNIGPVRCAPFIFDHFEIIITVAFTEFSHNQVDSEGMVGC